MSLVGDGSLFPVVLLRCSLRRTPTARRLPGITARKSPFRKHALTCGLKSVGTLATNLLTRQLNTLILSFRLVRNLSLNSICYAVRSPTSEYDGLRYFVAELIIGCQHQKFDTLSPFATRNQSIPCAPLRKQTSQPFLRYQFQNTRPKLISNCSKKRGKEKLSCSPPTPRVPCQVVTTCRRSETHQGMVDSRYWRYSVMSSTFWQRSV